MNTVREYRNPLLIAVGALVTALIIWAAFVSPQSSKLSTLKTKQTTLQTQATTLQVKLDSLKEEKQKLGKSCADLQKIATQIPSVESPTDVDAEESSFESQFNGLAATSGVTLSQFSGFTPASATAATPAATTPGSTASPAGVVAVPTTLTVIGNYGQITSFIKGLDSFPRLFVIHTFNLAFGASASGSTPGATSASAAATAAPSAGATPLWVGGTATSPSAGPYSVAIDGSIYYTSTPNALAACTKATKATIK